MSIKKEEFYKGAALYQLACAGGVSSLFYQPPFFIVNGRLILHLKYSTKGRSPWAFTFTPAEQILLHDQEQAPSLVIGLICGADGVARLASDAYRQIATLRRASVHISLYRRHGQHYSVKGPDGELGAKIAPSAWQRLLKEKGR